MCQITGELLLCRRDGLAPFCLLACSVVRQHFSYGGRNSLRASWWRHEAFLSDPHKPTGRTCHQASRSEKATAARIGPTRTACSVFWTGVELPSLTTEESLGKLRCEDNW